MLANESAPGSEIPIDDKDPDLFKTIVLFHCMEDLPDDFEEEKKAVNLL